MGGEETQEDHRENKRVGWNTVYLQMENLRLNMRDVDWWYSERNTIQIT